MKEDLIIDMEKRFDKREIRNSDDYIDLLYEYDNHEARITVMKSGQLFEWAINHCLVRNEKRLIKRDLK